MDAAYINKVGLEAKVDALMDETNFLSTFFKVMSARCPLQQKDWRLEVGAPAVSRPAGSSM